MEISKQEALAQIFKALGDPTRLRIFEVLRCCPQDVAVDESGECRPAIGSMTVGDVCCQIGGSASTISHHLRELRLAGLIRTEKQGRTIFCSVRPEAVALLQEFATNAASSCCAIPVESTLPS